MDFLWGLLVRLASTAFAFWLATLLIPGITLTTDSVTDKVTTVVLVAVIFGVVNAVLQPIVKFVGCGLYLLTLGLIALVVNGLLFLLTSWIAGQLDLPFHVDNFWPAAVLGALFVGVVTWLLGLVMDRD
jgi:putative membrane protein